MSERFYSIEFKLKLLKMCVEEHYSLSALASIYNVDRSTIEEWKYKFEKYGIGGLKKAPEPKKYSKELKLAAIQDYQSGRYSIREVVRKYEISNPSVLMKWLKYYNDQCVIPNRLVSLHIVGNQLLFLFKWTLQWSRTVPLFYKKPRQTAEITFPCSFRYS